MLGRFDAQLQVLQGALEKSCGLVETIAPDISFVIANPAIFWQQQGTNLAYLWLLRSEGRLES